MGIECLEILAHDEDQINHGICKVLWSAFEGHDWALYVQAKTEIKIVNLKAVEALMDSIRKYESKSTCKSIRHDRYNDDRLTSYQEADEHHHSSSDTVSKTGSTDDKIDHDIFVGRWLKTRRNYFRNQVGLQKFRDFF